MKERKKQDAEAKAPIASKLLDELLLATTHLDISGVSYENTSGDPPRVTKSR